MIFGGVALALLLVPTAAQAKDKDKASVCGDGVPTGQEECDGAHLGGATCETQGFVQGTLACDASCFLDTIGCSDDPIDRFEDLGETVIDHDTCLEWEKKTGTVGSGVNCESASCPDPHVVNNRYAWSNTDFLAKLNDPTFGAAETASDVTGCFAGHCNWRLPNIVELQTILDCSFGDPCIDPILGPAASSLYWSASTNARLLPTAWYANFSDGNVATTSKGIARFVRAVRARSCH